MPSTANARRPGACSLGEPQRCRSRRCWPPPSPRTRPALRTSHHRERMPIAMRIDTDHVVQLICKHPYRPPARGLGHDRCRSGDGNRGRQNCDGSRLKGGQASDQASKRAPGRYRTLRPDKSLEGHAHVRSFANRVTNKEHRHHPDNSPRRDHPHTHSSRMTPDEAGRISPSPMSFRLSVSLCFQGRETQSKLPRQAEVRHGHGQSLNGA